MNLLINILLGVLAFIVARYVLAMIGLDEAVGWIISVIVGIVVFVSNPAAQLNR